MSETHTHQIINYIGEHWPLLFAIIGAASGGVMWVKRKVINDVYATKEEMRACRSDLEKKFDRHEAAEVRRMEALTSRMNDNHDELKNLIIEQLSKKR